MPASKNMSKRTLLLSAILAGLSLCACCGLLGQLAKGARNPFFPTESGWLYTYKINIGGEVTGVLESNGKFMTNCFRVKGGALESAIDSGVENPSQWVVLIPKNVKANDSWTWVGSNNLQKSVMTCKEVGTWDDPPPSLAGYKGRSRIVIAQDDYAGLKPESLLHITHYEYEFVEGVGMTKRVLLGNPTDNQNPVIITITSLKK